MSAETVGPGAAGGVPEPVLTGAPLRGSVLLRAARVMWSTAQVALAAILGNAAVQGVLMYLDTLSGFSPAFLAAFLVSAVAALACYGVLASAALTAAEASGGSVLGRLRATWPQFAGWVAVQWLLMVAVSLVSEYLILLVAAFTPFLPLAAISGRRRAMSANFATIQARFGRWLVTALVMSVLAVLLYLLAVANTLFVQGTPAALIFWPVIGVVAWWTLTAWALIYVSVQPDRAAD